MTVLRPTGDTISAHRKRFLSALFGLGSAVVVGLVGPLYGGLVLLLAFPLVFRTASRVAPAWLLATFGVAWLFLLAAGGAPIVRNSPDAAGFWLALGVVPLALAGATVAAARLRQPIRAPDGRPS